jgi:cell wall-associated NlpC family hydrolase
VPTPEEHNYGQETGVLAIPDAPAAKAADDAAPAGPGGRFTAIAMPAVTEDQVVKGAPPPVVAAQVAPAPQSAPLPQSAPIQQAAAPLAAAPDPGGVQAAAALGGTPAQLTAVKTAESALGVEYVWGGNSLTSGIDCSGLTQQAWKAAGVDIPRTTYDQIKVGTEVDPANAGAFQPGDLLFPHRGHVMMYIGDGKVIEAPHRGAQVRIVPVSSRSYIEVRRPG